MRGQAAIWVGGDVNRKKAANHFSTEVGEDSV